MGPDVEYPKTDESLMAQRPPLSAMLESELEFTPEMMEAIYAAWHGAGVDIAGGNWHRFVGMLPVRSNAELRPQAGQFPPVAP